MWRKFPRSVKILWKITTTTLSGRETYKSIVYWPKIYFFYPWRSIMKKFEKRTRNMYSIYYGTWRAFAFTLGWSLITKIISHLVFLWGNLSLQAPWCSLAILLSTLNILYCSLYFHCYLVYWFLFHLINHCIIILFLFVWQNKKWINKINEMTPTLSNFITWKPAEDNYVRVSLTVWR